MAYFTSNIYFLKREILTFTNKISKHLPKPEKKFAADITYEMFIKRVTMLQKPVSLQPAIILSAFSPTSILHRKKTISLQITFYISLCMAFLAMISMESETNALKVSILKTADPVKEKVYLKIYYQQALCISLSELLLLILLQFLSLLIQFAGSNRF